MTPIYRCGDQEALVAYLYEECSPEERGAIAAHIAQCEACAEEAAALRSTRTLLAGWTPPASSLGFRITGPAEREPVVLRPAAWWRQPLPAWAQAAAAVLIFAAGMAAGMGRAASPASPAAAPAGASAARPAARDTAPAAAVTRDDLARLEQRLAAAEALASRPRTTPAASAGSAADEDAIVRRIETLLDYRIAESEARQRSENVRLIADVARTFEVQERQVRALGQVHESTVRELRQHRDALDSIVPLVRVSFAQPAAAR